MISFSNFRKLDPAALDLVLELLATANNQRPPFTSFIYRWMAFNGWMSAVTLEDTDATMIRALIVSPRLAAAYQQLMADDPQFRQMLDDFSGLWPVLNVRDVRAKLGYDAFRQHDHAGLLAACAKANVKQEPAGWVLGSAPAWDQMMRALYQVRCNLFHGEKSPQNFRDRDLVFAADRVLLRFIVATGCFDWYDL